MRSIPYYPNCLFPIFWFSKCRRRNSHPCEWPDQTHITLRTSQYPNCGTRTTSLIEHGLRFSSRFRVRFFSRDATSFTLYCQGKNVNIQEMPVRRFEDFLARRLIFSPEIGSAVTIAL